MVSDETPEGAIVDELSPRDAIDMKALNDIFSGNKKRISYYYGQDSTNPSRDSTYWAGILTENHPDAAKRYLNVRRTEFKPSELSTNAITDYLDEKVGMDRQLVKRVNNDYHKLLVLVFYVMYDPNDESLGTEYKKLVAKTKIFKDNKEQVYYHDESFDVEEVSEDITDHVSEQNDDAAQGFAIEQYPDKEAGEVRMKMFKESSRTGERIFQFRKEGKKEPPANPTVEYESTHNIKTIGLRARNTDNGAVFTFSKSLGRWETDLEEFFADVFEIEDAWEALDKAQVDGASRVVEEVKETADDEEATDKDVADSAIGVMSEMSDAVINEMETSDDVTDEEFDEAERLYESIRLTGLEINQDKETGTVEFSVETEEEFEVWTNNIDEIEAGMKALMARAEQENINLIYEVSPAEGETERFRVSDGTWEPTGRGMDSGTIDLINNLLTESDDDE